MVLQEAVNLSSRKAYVGSSPTLGAKYFMGLSRFWQDSIKIKWTSSQWSKTLNVITRITANTDSFDYALAA